MSFPWKGISLTITAEASLRNLCAAIRLNRSIEGSRWTIASFQVPVLAMAAAVFGPWYPASADEGEEAACAPIEDQQSAVVILHGGRVARGHVDQIQDLLNVSSFAQSSSRHGASIGPGAGLATRASRGTPARSRC